MDNVMSTEVDKDVTKIKVTYADVIVRMVFGKPYYEIKYNVIGSNEINIGYGSHELNNVFDWLNECFEVVKHKSKVSNVFMLKLSDTVEGMTSDDYKERFKAEYNQLKIRFIGLMNMCAKWSRNELTFEPTCPRTTYEMQLKAMNDYLAILEMRAAIEGIELDV